MIQYFQFNETCLNVPGTVASSQTVTGGAVYPLPGIAFPLDDCDGILVVAELTGPTGGTLDVYLQVSPNQGLNWYDIVHFPQIPAAQSLKVYEAPISLHTNTNATTQVGKDLVPFLPANTVLNGAFLDRARVLMVTGAGVTVAVPVLIRVVGQRVHNRNIA